MLPGHNNEEAPNSWIVIKLMLISLPFQLLIVPGLPLNVPISLVIIFCAVFVLLGKVKRTMWVGVEGSLVLFAGVALLSIVLALLTTPEQVFQVLPDSYGLRGSKFRGLYQICIMLAWYLTAWVVVNCCSSIPALHSVLRFWLLFVIALNGYGCYEVLADKFGLPMYYLSTSYSVEIERPHVLGLQRAYSVFGEPTHYASFLVMNLALAWGLRMHLPEEARIMGLPVKTVFVSSCAALYLTASAAGFAVFGVIMCAMTLSTLRNSPSQGGRTGVLLAACVGLATIVFVSGLGDVLFEQKFSKVEALADQDREVIESDARTKGLMLGLEAFQEHPVLGVGFGNEPFYTYMPEVSDLTFGSFSMAVSRLLEVGVVGTVCFAALIWRMFFPRFRSRRNALGITAYLPLVSALRWGLAGSMAYRLWFGPTQLNAIDWLCAGLIAAATRISQSHNAFGGSKDP